MPFLLMVGLLTAVRAAGFANLVQQDDGHDLLYTHAGEVLPVYVRLARSPGRFAMEVAALRLLQRHSGAALVAPRLLAALPEVGDGVLLLSYEPGFDLADFIPAGAAVPPMPPTYRPKVPPQRPGLLVALAGLGTAVYQLHQIPAPKFGLLVGNDPNPHHYDGRRHTMQETAHRLGLVVQRGWLTPSQVGAVQRWLAGRWELLEGEKRPFFTHFDLHAGNIRLAQDEAGRWCFRRLLDFELARGWLPEFDLATLSWYLRHGDGDWWEAFVAGYGGLTPRQQACVTLFEMIKGLETMAFSKAPTDWSQWGQARVLALLAAE